MEWVLGSTVVLAVAVSMVLVDRIRRVRLRKRVRLEIANAGNVRSRYDLRAEEPAGALQFEFTVAGDSLPTFGRALAANAQVGAAEKAGRKARAGGRASRAGSVKGGLDRAGRALQVASAVAGVMSMIGSLLPRSIGGPLQQKASEIRNVQMRASYVQQAPERIAFQTSSVARVVTGKGDAPMRPGRRIRPEELEAQEAALPPAGGEMVPGAARGALGAAAGVAGDGLVWAQTPYVEPGETLVVEMRVGAGSRAGSQAHAPAQQGYAPGVQGYAFQVISRAADREADQPVSARGSVHIRGGFWARRILPYLVVTAITVVVMVALVFLGYWLVAAGVLA